MRAQRAARFGGLNVELASARLSHNCSEAALYRRR